MYIHTHIYIYIYTCIYYKYMYTYIYMYIPAHKRPQYLYIDIPWSETSKECVPMPPVHSLAFSAPFV